MTIENTTLFKIAIVIGVLSLAAAAVQIISRNSNTQQQAPDNFPEHPFPLVNIDTGQELDLTSAINSNKYTIVWVVRIGCKACEIALVEEWDSIRNLETQGIPVHIIVENYSAIRFKEFRDTIGKPYTLFSTSLNIYSAIKYRRAPSCYLVEAEKRVINRTVSYPRGWYEILDFLSNGE